MLWDQGWEGQAVLCPPSLPIHGDTKVDLEVTAKAGSQQGRWGGTVVVVTESKFCKNKMKRDHIAHLIVCLVVFFFKEGWKIPNSAFGKMGKEKRTLRNTQNVVRSSCRELVKGVCSSTGFYLALSQLPLSNQVFLPPLYFWMGRETKRLKTYVTAQGRKGQASSSLLLPWPWLTARLQKTEGRQGLADWPDEERWGSLL